MSQMSCRVVPSTVKDLEFSSNDTVNVSNVHSVSVCLSGLQSITFMAIVVNMLIRCYHPGAKDKLCNSPINKV